MTRHQAVGAARNPELMAQGALSLKGVWCECGAELETRQEKEYQVCSDCHAEWVWEMQHGGPVCAEGGAR